MCIRDRLKYRTVYKHMQEFLDIRYHVKDLSLIHISENATNGYE